MFVKMNICIPPSCDCVYDLIEQKLRRQQEARMRLEAWKDLEAQQAGELEQARAAVQQTQRRASSADPGTSASIH